ncbi:MAG: WD40 repeat domain-containing protein, partial [Planctomycetaceae bacterium]|nr:WD40 repeat domain-containing protein [Planctomycetaceae bacterium]
MKLLIMSIVLLASWYDVSCAEEYRDLIADKAVSFLQVAFSSDDLLLAAAGGGAKAPRGAVAIWNLQTGAVVARLTDFPDQCCRIQFSPDDAGLAVSCGDGSIHLFQRSRDIWRRVNLLKARDKARVTHAEEMQYTADGRRLIMTANQSNPGKLRMTICRGIAGLSLEGQHEPQLLLPFAPCIVSSLLRLDEAGRQLLVERGNFGRGQDLVIVDVVAKEVVKTIEIPLTPGELSSHQSIRTTPDGKKIAFSRGRRVYAIDRESFEIKPHFDSPEPLTLYAGLSFSADGTRLATSSDEGTITVWDYETGTPLVSRKHELSSGVYFSNTGKFLASMVNPSKVQRVWNVDELL